MYVLLLVREGAMRTILFFISMTLGLAVSVGNAQEDVSTISLPIRIHLKKTKSPYAPKD